MPFDKLRVLHLAPQEIHLLTIKQIVLIGSVYTGRAIRQLAESRNVDHAGFEPATPSMPWKCSTK